MSEAIPAIATGIHMKNTREEAVIVVGGSTEAWEYLGGLIIVLTWILINFLQDTFTGSVCTEERYF